MNKLFEMLFSPFTSKEDKKFDDPEETLDMQELPNAEDNEEPELDFNSSAFYTVDFDIKFKTIKDAILTYREIASNFEIEEAIDEIVYSSIVVNDNSDIVSLNLDNIEDNVISKQTKDKIRDEFNEVLRLLRFNRKGQGYFRRWYIDGRLWFQILTNNNSITKLNLLSPLDITRAKENGKVFYIYKQDERNKNLLNRMQRERLGVEEGLKIPEKNVAFVPSGITDPKNHYYVSHLHKSIKPLNQLKLLEDSAVIYRITRAPERRVFYIDVGKLRKSQAEQYVTNLSNKFKSSIAYDAQTGKVTQRKNVMTMLEDFYLPSRGDSKGTKVDILQGGTQLGEIEDILYFKKKLLKSLKVPVSRFDDENQPVVDLGRSGELTRSELKFNKFIKNLRKDFSVLFLELLKTQLILKNIVKISEFNEIRDLINFIWESDSYFAELKEQEILSSRLEVADSMSEYIGKYFSHEWVRKNIFKMNDDEIDEMKKQIEEEKKSGEIEPEEEM